MSSEAVTQYVAGLLFSEDRKRVALIRKMRPEWQRGKLNGIGGHIEPAEFPGHAMVREFNEEAGALINDWEHFCTLRGKTWVVEWYKAFHDADIKEMTDEWVSWFYVEHAIVRDDIIPNVRWLIMMALDDVRAVVDEE